MSDEIQSEASQRMGKAIEAMRVEFGKVRTGRANPAILSDLKIDYYGVPTPVTQLAGVKAADGHQLIIDPWDKKSLRAIEKAIMASDLGITPTNDGNIIRLPFPAPSEEGRKELVKQCREIAEQTRVSIRNARRDANNRYERAEKDGDVAEDDVNRGKSAIQKLTDDHIAKVDALLKEKEAEVMEV